MATCEDKSFSLKVGKEFVSVSPSAGESSLNRHLGLSVNLSNTLSGYTSN